MDTILVVNAGSSSLKFQLFDVDPLQHLKRRLKGQVDGVGSHPRLRAAAADGTAIVDQVFSTDELPDMAAAMQVATDWLRSTQQHVNLLAVGHRVVHGGPSGDQPRLVTPEVLAVIERCIPLAPLHQPHNLAPIRVLAARRPDLPQVACFDTAFHRSHGPLADHFAIPLTLYEEGVRRYGFHGLSYEYIASRLPAVAPDIAGGRVIVAHLGSGASMCALENGRSIDSTMGFTGLDGLPMGTRPGQIDPGVILHLMSGKGWDAAAIERFLYHECGLKGLSGISNDMRELEASDDPRAAFAVDYFVYRVALSTGMLAAALGGLDAFVFTAGIGENSAAIRARVAARLAWLGVKLDPTANARRDLRISAPDSRIPVLVVPTDEESMIARHTLAVVTAQANA
ncbi:MAG: acetate/propionate family kinase [Methylacidiphilales bacterium]|nr:acetate/propionate family kinase [Candidatus Methylacidiphilales bacterium]